MTTPGSEPLDLSQLDRNFRAEEFTAEDFQSMVERIEWLESALGDAVKTIKDIFNSTSKRANQFADKYGGE